MQNIILKQLPGPCKICRKQPKWAFKINTPTFTFLPPQSVGIQKFVKNVEPFAPFSQQCSFSNFYIRLNSQKEKYTFLFQKSRLFSKITNAKINPQFRDAPREARLNSSLDSPRWGLGDSKSLKKLSPRVFIKVQKWILNLAENSQNQPFKSIPRHLPFFLRNQWELTNSLSPPSHFPLSLNIAVFKILIFVVILNFPIMF